MNVAALRAYLTEAAATPAKLGGLDCVRFVLEARLAGWREDWRDCLHYHDRRSAIAQLREAGGLRAAFEAELGELVPVAELGDGDVAWLEDPTTGTAAVGLVLSGVALLKKGRTLFRIPLAHVDEGWHWPTWYSISITEFRQGWPWVRR